MYSCLCTEKIYFLLDGIAVYTTAQFITFLSFLLKLYVSRPHIASAK